MFRIDNKNGKIYYDEDKMIEHLANKMVNSIPTFFNDLYTNNYSSQTKLYINDNNNITHAKVIIKGESNLESIMVTVDFSYKKEDLKFDFEKLKKISFNEFSNHSNKLLLLKIIEECLYNEADLKNKEQIDEFMNSDLEI